VADAEGEQNPVERTRFAGRDTVDQVLRLFLFKSFEAEQLCFLQVVEIGGAFNQAGIDKQFNDGFTEAVNVHAIARGKVCEPAFEHGGVVQVVNAPGDFAFDFDRMDPQFFAGSLHVEGLFDSGALLCNDADDGRNDFAGLFDDYAVADADVFAFDLVFVVERGALNNRSGELHRFKFGDGRQHAGAADLDGDFLEKRFGLLRLVFIGDGPARAFRGRAECFIEIALVDFDDAAVHFERELMPHVVQRIEPGEDFLNFGADPELRSNA